MNQLAHILTTLSISSFVIAGMIALAIECHYRIHMEKMRRRNNYNGEVMTCQEYFEYYFDKTWSNLANEMHWDGGLDSSLAFNVLQRHALNNGVVLEDLDTWDYENYFHNAYRDTEKGLS